MDCSRKIDKTVLDSIRPVIIASASTRDGTQVKRLWAFVGQRKFQVTRCYSGDLSAVVVHEGCSLDAAIRFYNGMG